VIEALHAARDARARRYYWEGGFFLVVLITGMAVVIAAMRHDAALRRRQQNFLAGVSHEFKSPLASIRLAAESLARRGSASDTARWTPRIIADCERLLRTVDNLLDTARLEDGRHRVTARRVVLGAAIDQAIDEQSARASGDGIALVQDIDDPDLALDVDPEALASILRNLIDNGIKACVAGDGSRVTVSVRSEQDAVTLRVSDDGMGFPPSESALLFEKFYRVGDERQRRTSGSGLGLYLVLRLTQLSGARVHADSAGPGRGATITVRWPPERRA
jgi:signal transduction histidine kinase